MLMGKRPASGHSRDNEYGVFVAGAVAIMAFLVLIVIQRGGNLGFAAAPPPTAPAASAPPCPDSGRNLEKLAIPCTPGQKACVWRRYLGLGRATPPPGYSLYECQNSKSWAPALGSSAYNNPMVTAAFRDCACTQPVFPPDEQLPPQKCSFPIITDLKTPCQEQGTACVYFKTAVWNPTESKPFGYNTYFKYHCVHKQWLPSIGVPNYGYADPCCQKGALSPL